MIGKKQNAFLFAHQANIDRYQRILQTQLTAEERHFVERFLAEQQAALKQRSPALMPPATTARPDLAATAKLSDRCAARFRLRVFHLKLYSRLKHSGCVHYPPLLPGVNLNQSPIS
jgi:hypothetical protein